MKDMKLIHLAIATILILIALAAVQWLMLPPMKVAPATAAPAAGTVQPAELPVLPQIEIYNKSVVKYPAEKAPPFKESVEENEREGKSPNMMPSGEKVGF